MFKQAKRKKLLMLFSAVILIAGLLFTPVFAWRMDKSSAILTVNSSIVGSYFEQGNGTADTPYVIARPIQLYYLSWLQNMGYFDGDNDESTTSDKRFYFTLGTDIDMSDSSYSTLPPIGTPDHPFVGVFNGRYHYAPANNADDPFDPDNTIEGTYHVISNLTVSNTGLSHMPTGGDDGQQYIGLFGVVGSMTDTTVQGEIKNFALDNVTVETTDPDNDRTIVGIVAGYCNGIVSGIGVSDCTITVANGVSPATLTVHNTNPDTGVVTTETKTPETLSFSLIGFSDVTYQAYNISPVAGGNEFGGSLAMESIYNRIIAAKGNANAGHLQHYYNKVVNIDEYGERTETFSNGVDVDYHRSISSSALNSANYYFITEYEKLDDGDVTESYSLVDRYSNATQAVLGDGLGHYIVATTNSISSTTNFNSATRFTISASGSYYRFAYNSNYYLRYNNGLTISNSTTNANWAVTEMDANFQTYTIKNSSGNYYLNYDNGWVADNTPSARMNIMRTNGSGVSQYTYLNGGKTIQKQQNVTTITRTLYDAFNIGDGNGHYLIGTPSGISSTTNIDNATAWRFSNGASGGTFTIQDDNEVVYYLRNNNGSLEISSTNSTNWVISNGEITNGGYYLTYLDGAWKLWQETVYYYIDNGSGTYLNISNGNVVGNNTASTRWHFDNNNKMYYYNGTTKTYLYNNNGTLTTTTTVGTATAWTIDNANHTLKNGGDYLIYVDGAWRFVTHTTYYYISNGNNTYLNISNGNVVGNNTASTRWHLDGNSKLYYYNGATKTYLYNNNGVLATTTTAGTANAWTIDGANHRITNGGYYLVYLDGVWQLLAETTYYYINNGSGIFLNMSGTTITATNSSSTRWHLDGSNKLYYYNGTTKTYLYSNGGVLTTTTNVNTANAWTFDSANHRITNGSYYLCYSESTWALREETTYYYINNGNNTYLNMSGTTITASSSASTNWHLDNNNKLYYYNGATKTYLYNNNGVLATTTTAGTANAWTIDNANHNITNGGYYLCYNGYTWILTQETGYYLINDGNLHYLNLTSNGIETGTSSNATQWYASNDKYYTYINGTATYLYNNNGVLSTTTNSATASTFTFASNNFKTGNYYLVYQDGWMLTEETVYYTINDGNNHYLNLTGSGYESGTSGNATKWRISSGKIYTLINGTLTYMYNNSGVLSTTTNSATATVWTVGANTITNGDYYLTYQNGWMLTNETGFYTIRDNSTHYLNLTSSGYETGTSSNATQWHFTNGNSGGKIYTYINGTATYLYNNNGVLSTTTNSATASTWAISNGQITSGGYYLLYSGGWRLVASLSYYTISDGSGHYLNLTGSGYSVGTSSNATDWQITNTSSGKIYTYINGTPTYIYRNGGTLSTTTAEGTATTWAIDNSAKTIENGGYYLYYNGSSWALTNTLKYFISDNAGHYLNLNASSHLTEIGTSSNATEWTFTATGNNYYISADANGTPYYLNYDSSNMVPGTTRSTAWTVSGSTIYCTSNSTNYYMFCDGQCWTIVRNGLTSYYLISDGNGNYLSCTTSGITNETVRSYARKWEFGSGISTSTSSTILTNINGSSYYLNRASSGGWNATYSLSITTSSVSNWRYNSGNRYIYYYSSGWFGGGTSYYARYYNNGWTSLTTTATSIGSISNINNFTTTAVRTLPQMVGYASGSYNATNTTAYSAYDLTLSLANSNYNLTINRPYTTYILTANAVSNAYNLTANAASNAYNLTANAGGGNYTLTANAVNNSYDLVNALTATTVVWKNTIQTIETVDVKGKETYIPLSLADDGTTSLRNTGYIVSGSNYPDLDTYSGDIRVSYYPISSNLNNALGSQTSYSSSRLEVVTRSYLSGNEFVRISDSYNANNSNTSSTLTSAVPTKSSTNTTPLALGLGKYTDAREQLHETLNGATNVYGLHFMDAQISTSRLVSIGKATLNGETYYNYEMPQDCIDFNLNTRGALTFFAGTYFPGNTAFFSLHKIERNEGVITSIKEIDKIYGNPSNNGLSYLYKYVGESAPTLPTGYVEMFDTTWIKSPTLVTNAMYYFEIPVNAGEYALGSVAGADGAYLIYLDIGATSTSLSDGTTLETAIKGIDFVTASSIESANIATTLSGISASDNSCAVIVLRNRFQGDINFVRTDNGNNITVTYTISDSSSAEYVKWTKESNTTSVVASGTS